ncbi:MAG: DUF3971 domain-containing protein, partial [Halocynthiibacter sp.]
ETPMIEVENMVYHDASGDAVGFLPSVRSRFSSLGLLRGKIVPVSLEARGLKLYGERDETGQIGLVFGSGVEARFDFTNVEAQIDALLAELKLSGLREIDLRDVDMRFMDLRTDHGYFLTNGAVYFENNATALEGRLNFEFSEEFDQGAFVAVQARLDRRTGIFTTSAELNDVKSHAVAGIDPSLAWLGFIDAPVSGALRTNLTEKGQFENSAGTLELGAGRVTASAGNIPLGFDQGKLYFTVDHARKSMQFDEFSLKSDLLNFTASGRMFLKNNRSGTPEALTGQFNIDALTVTDSDIFDTPVEIKNGSIDVAADLENLSLTVGSFVVPYQGAKVVISGEFDPQKPGYGARVDLQGYGLTPAIVQSGWPKPVAVKARAWFMKNVSKGRFETAQASLRMDEDGHPQSVAQFTFEGVDIRYSKTLAPLLRAKGYGNLKNTRFALGLEEGVVKVPKGGEVNVSGTQMRVDNIRQKPADGQFNIAVDGQVTDILRYLNAPPLSVMDKAKRPVDIASGRVVAALDLRLPLRKKVPKELVKFTGAGHVTGVKSTKIAKSIAITADRLALTVDNSHVALSGRALVNDVPFDGRWQQNLTKGDQSGSVLGTAVLSQAFVKGFNLNLPEGSVKGKSHANVEIRYSGAGKAPSLLVTSALKGLDLRIASLGWRKSPKQKAGLRVEGRLSVPMAIDRLELTAPGFTAKGAMSFAEIGFKSLDLKELKVGSWLDVTGSLGAVSGTKSPKMTLKTGTLDLRRLPKSVGPNTGGGAGNAIDVALDRVIVADGLILTNVKAAINTKGGISGPFSGRINGNAPVSGILKRHRNGVAIDIQANDGGRVLKSAKVYSSARGGRMTVRLTPLGRGRYDGHLVIKDTRVADAPELARMIGALSIVGLLQQLNGDGIHFSTVEGQFAIDPALFQLKSGRAVGASMGITLEGFMDLKSKHMNMQGVFSPIYFINSVGQVFSKKGEGLLGFNFSLKGHADDAKIKVNPISALAPGFLRGLFRKDLKKPKAAN